MIANTQIYAVDLAKYVISYVSKHSEKHRNITNLKLQKILYYIEGYFMAEYGHALYPARIDAWQFGPVVPSVYYEYVVNGCLPLEMTDNEIAEAETKFKSAIEDKTQRALINRVIEEKMNLGLWQLVNDTKSEPPWIQATRNGKRIGGIITKRSIMQYFCNKNKS